MSAADARDLSYDELSQIERLRASEQSRLEAEVARLREALSTAADDLDKAANQFDGIRQSQLAGYSVSISNNPARFAEKAERARAALDASPERP